MMTLHHHPIQFGVEASIVLIGEKITTNAVIPNGKQIVLLFFVKSPEEKRGP